MPLSDAAAGAALHRFLDRLPNLRLVVVGDVILDRFLYGVVDRISPEAPVPVVDVESEVFRLGGAANVVQNLTALGAGVVVRGVVGADTSADRLRRELEIIGVDASGLLELPQRPTAIKTRVIAQHQQVVRFDREHRGPLPQPSVRQLLDAVFAELDRLDGVIVSDYGKGVVGQELMSGLVSACRDRGLPLVVDPKPVNADLYRGASVMTPNAKETEAITGIPVRSDEDAERAGAVLLERYAGDAALVTRGEKGMTLVQAQEGPVHIGTRARDVFDVTGAGDTTIAVLTLALAAGCSYPEAAYLANVAAGVVVAKLGTAALSVDELRDAVGATPVAES